MLLYDVEPDDQVPLLPKRISAGSAWTSGAAFDDPESTVDAVIVEFDR